MLTNFGEETSCIRDRPMFGASSSGDGDAVIDERSTEHHGGVLGRIFDGYVFDVGLVFEGDGAVEAEGSRSDEAGDLNAGGLRLALDRSGFVLDGVIGDGLFELDGGGLAGSGGSGGEAELVVGYGEGADGGAVSPDGVVDGPVLWIGIPREEGVVADDVAGNLLDAFGGELGDEIVDIVHRVGLVGEGRLAGGRFGAGGGRDVGKVLAVEVGVACADEREVAFDDAGGGVERAGDAGLDAAIRAEESHGSSGGVERGVAGGLEELTLVQAVEGGSVEGGDVDAPVVARDGWIGNERGNLGGK